MPLIRSAVIIFIALLGICSSPTASAKATKVMLGIDVLEGADFKPLKGKRVGLLTNPAGVNRNGVSTIDVLRNSAKVNLVALYGPEHGIYGDEKANVPVDDKIDTRTGLPVFSLYGKYRKPTPKMLKPIDILVIDLQDLGVRSYTYVSCMRYCIEACFEANKEVMVLDRPNPIGGLKVDGPPIEEKWMSYVGAYPVPYVHGLTIGELARMAKNEKGWLKIDDKLRERSRLIIVPMAGWKRDMLWADTGLKWKATSPAIQNISSAMGYAMTGLGTQLGGFSHGYGSDYSFRSLTFNTKPPQDIYQTLMRRKLPGLDFIKHKYKNYKGKEMEGVFVIVKDWNKCSPTELSFHMMQIAAAWKHPKNPFKEATKNQASLFNKHTGTSEWWNEITTRGPEARVKHFINKWKTGSTAFQERSRKYYIYKD